MTPTNSSMPRHALTLTEVVAVVALVVILTLLAFWALAPEIINCGIPANAMFCMSNLKNIGTSCRVYATANDSSWPVPAFDETWSAGIDYTMRAGSGEGSVRSPNRRQLSIGGPDGARQLSVTRSLWMLLQSYNLAPHMFVCREAGDMADPNDDVHANYDFSSPHAVSYGLQIPFGPRCTRTTDRTDNRFVVAADRGPYSNAMVPVPPAQKVFSVSTASPPVGSVPTQWRKYNSPNHGGKGQFVLFADGHVEFKRTPIVGVDHDNIYTIASEGDEPWARTSGESPWKRSASPRVEPGCSEQSPTKDSVIFP